MNEEPEQPPLPQDAEPATAAQKAGIIVGLAAVATATFLVVKSFSGGELHIDTFGVKSVTNFIGNSAKEFTYVISGNELGSTNYILFKQEFTNDFWIPIGAYIATNETMTLVRTQAQAFLQNGGFFRIYQFE